MSHDGNWASTTAPACVIVRFTMAKYDDTHKLSWPGWGPWVLLAIAVTSLLTIAATLYDIL